MSYQTYTTEAIIIASFETNEADKSYLMFTKTAGMLYASARSVREERSRQRYALQDFSQINVSLIKGKTGWKIGSVQSEGNIFTTAASREARGSVVRIFKNLKRFVAGEEVNPALYQDVTAALAIVAQTDLPHRTVVDEIIFARLLYHLGYIANSEKLADILNEDILSVLTRELPDSLSAGLKTITEKAITASHL